MSYLSHQHPPPRTPNPPQQGARRPCDRRHFPGTHRSVRLFLRWDESRLLVARQTAALGPDFLLRSEPVRNCLSFMASVNSQLSGLAILAKMASAPACGYPLALTPGAFTSMKPLCPGWWNSASSSACCCSTSSARGPESRLLTYLVWTLL
jgi:hypothetical protein